MAWLDRDRSSVLIARVAQKDEWGCAIACAAMVLGVAYDDVAMDLPEKQRARLIAGEPPRFNLETYLQSHGIACSMRWPDRPVRVDPAWRPQPRTAVSVYSTSRSCDLESVIALHAIVVLPDGTIIDPNTTSPAALAELVVWHVLEVTSS